MITEKRTLITRPDRNIRMTDGVIKRRAMSIAQIIGAVRVEIDKGSEPSNKPWVFSFFKTSTEGAAPVLELTIRGARGSVYTALGNYHSGIASDL